MPDFPPPPTYAEVVVTDPITKKQTFNPVWLKWFLEAVALFNASGGTTTNHNSTSGKQGGTAGQYYHVTQAQFNDIAATFTGSVTQIQDPLRPTTATGATQTGQLFMGSGVPAAANGNNGDFYFRTGGNVGSSDTLYHKEAGAWVPYVF